MKIFYIINRFDMRENAKIEERDLPDLILSLLDRNDWLPGQDVDEMTIRAEKADIPELYCMLDELEFDILDNKQQLIDYIAQNR